MASMDSCLSGDHGTQAGQYFQISNQQTGPKPPIHEIFLPYLDTPGTENKLVDFDAALDEDDVMGRHVLIDVKENGLAYSGGFRTGDILLEVNGASTEGEDIGHILDSLRSASEVNLILAVERSQGTSLATFIWIIFKVFMKDGAPAIEVIRTLENDDYEMPSVDFGWTTYGFQNRSDKPKDIYIDKPNEPLYLGIENKRLVFSSTPQSYFYRYTYTGGVPSKGTTVAYSTEAIALPTFLAKSAPAGNASSKALVMNFPKSMIRKAILPNPRFWYERINPSDGTFTLESVKAQDMYLGMDENHEAILSKDATKLRIAVSCQLPGPRPPPCTDADEQLQEENM